MSKYKDNIKIDLESRIGGPGLNSSGSGQQNVMDVFQFIEYRKNHKLSKQDTHPRMKHKRPMA
jgi:hypothetical protein